MYKVKVNNVIHYQTTNKDKAEGVAEYIMKFIKKGESVKVYEGKKWKFSLIKK